VTVPVNAGLNSPVNKPVSAHVSSSVSLPSNWGMALQALRERGLQQRDPLGLHHLETLAGRLGPLQGEARRCLEERMARKLAALQALAPVASDDALAVAPAPAPAPAPPSAPSRRPLAELLAYLQSRDGPGEPQRELRTLRAHRDTWARLRDEQRLAQALSSLPPNAGPLNSHRLVLRALQRMRELSPGYFHHFLAHLETLQGLEQAGATPAASPAARPRASPAKPASRPASRPSAGRPKGPRPKEV
jgi:Protein of unknown function (DUF2894)